MATDFLKDLDDRIQAAVNKIHQLRQENEQLHHRLAESEKRSNEVTAQVKQFEQERRQHETERSEIKTRIEKILARFDGLDLG
jgi:predicted nuclease with TOPRIM domain